MTHRQTLSTSRPDCVVSVVTEPRRDGRWAVVANIEEQHDDAVQVHPLQLPEGVDASFASEDQARAFAVDVAERWIAQNTPKDSGVRR